MSLRIVYNVSKLTTFQNPVNKVPSYMPSFIQVLSYMSPHTCPCNAFIHVPLSRLSHPLIHLYMYYRTCSLHAIPFTNVYPYISIRTCPFVHVHSYMSIRTCPFVHVHSYMSIRTYPFVHVLLYMFFYACPRCTCLFDYFPFHMTYLFVHVP